MAGSESSPLFCVGMFIVFPFLSNAYKAAIPKKNSGGKASAVWAMYASQKKYENGNDKEADSGRKGQIRNYPF